MASEKFCLRWNDFESNISVAFRELREDKDFFDITLSCGEEQMQAHKVILAACSPFFRSVLKNNPHSHPLLYLKGVRFSDLQSVLNFMYHGEVNVAQEDLNSFLAVAEELKVKGLTQGGDGNLSQEAQKSVFPNTSSSSTRPVQTAPPAKRPRPIPPQPPVHDVVQDDQVEEIARVKQEPLIAAPYVVGQVEDEGYEVEEEGYEDYGQYDGYQQDLGAGKGGWNKNIFKL